MAKGVRLVAVRVLDCCGSGSWSGVIAGIDWVTANHVKPAVANMSLGGAANAAVDEAVADSIAAGVTYAVAAGNDNHGRVHPSPRPHPSAITVGATDINDARASFSNFGTCLDIFAPGDASRRRGTAATRPPTPSAVPPWPAPTSPAPSPSTCSSTPPTWPSTVSAAVARFSTEDNLVGNAGTGSKNLLLYTGSIAASAAPSACVPPPATTSSPRVAVGATSARMSPRLGLERFDLIDKMAARWRAATPFTSRPTRGSA